MQEILVQFLGQEDSLENGQGHPVPYSWASLVAQIVKNSPAMLETWVQSLDWEDPLEEGMATHSSILAWNTLAWNSMERGARQATVHRVTKSQA